MADDGDVADLRERLARREAQVADLRAQLAAAQSTSEGRASQLERYASDLNAAFLAERDAAGRLQRSYRATVRALANAVEARDAYTGRHAERVTGYGVTLADRVGMEATPEVEFGFLLHDIGKVAVPDAILFKPAGLTVEEHAVMARHPVTGVEVLRDVSFLGDARLVVRHHHERWDGSGYPDGLAGEAIPWSARVFAVADALDALTTDRPYRPRSSFGAARDVIRAAAGEQFDPAVVMALDDLADDALLATQEAAA